MDSGKFFPRLVKESETSFYERLRKVLLMGDAYIPVYGDIKQLVGCLVVPIRKLERHP